MVNNGHAEAAGSFEIEGAIVNEDALPGLALGDGKRDAKDTFFGLAVVEITGAEEDLKGAAEVEGFDAVLIEFERLIVDGANEIFVGLRAGIENRSRARIFL